MRTDVKIGVATGLLLVIALVAWQLIFNSNGDKTKDGNSPGEPIAAVPAERPGSGLPRFGIVPSTPPRPGSTAPVAPVTPTIRETPPAIPPAPVVPSIRETPPAPAIGPVEPAIPSIRETPPAIPPAPVVPSIRETPAPPAPVIPSIREVPVAPVTPVGPVTPVTPVGPVIRETPVTPGLGATTPGVTVEETYEVQKGDSGFWAIAEKKYGDGKYYYLIAKANPNVSSNSLRPGQKLVIPAKPVGRTEPTSPGTGSPTPGGVEISPSGQQIYVVQKGDSGFWAIAQKKYGDGKYYYLIAKANPNVSSNSLQPGDKLVLPDKPAATTPVTGGSTTAPAAPAATPLTPGPGQEVYTVTKEDTTGFWGIAKKKYGNGAYWKIIAQANPKVDASVLKVGQQLILPAPPPEAKKASTGETATRPKAPGAPAAKRTDIEDVGPTPRFR
jgi:nucleoid-associated protein YgaU